jgi:hypothetical protein
LDVLDSGDAETVTILQIPTNLGGDLAVAINCPLAPEELQGEKSALAAYHPEFSVVLGFHYEVLQHCFRLDALGEAGDAGTVDSAAGIVRRIGAASWPLGAVKRVRNFEEPIAILMYR